MSVERLTLRSKDIASVQKVLHARMNLQCESLPTMMLRTTERLLVEPYYRYSTANASLPHARIFPVWHFQSSQRLFATMEFKLKLIFLLLGSSTKSEAISRPSVYYRKQFAYLLYRKCQWELPSSLLERLCVKCVCLKHWYWYRSENSDKWRKNDESLFHIFTDLQANAKNLLIRFS